MYKKQREKGGGKEGEAGGPGRWESSDPRLFSMKCHNCKKGFIKHQSQQSCTSRNSHGGLGNETSALNRGGNHHCLAQVISLLTEMKKQRGEEASGGQRGKRRRRGEKRKMGKGEFECMGQLYKSSECYGFI